ncbi:hypothetical protein [Pseudofrankia sp. DC12]|uniref:hypothetical protein n=1 Tax=Pseudofrankia sp. DC12 TaxID=683315 RepID=UPI0005F82BEB|nr:hypothetical protein [Pseudofrankia sp. DC12]
MPPRRRTASTAWCNAIRAPTYQPTRDSVVRGVPGPRHRYGRLLHADNPARRWHHGPVQVVTAARAAPPQPVLARGPDNDEGTRLAVDRTLGTMIEEESGPEQATI